MGDYQQTVILFMVVYLVYAIVYNFIMNEFHARKYIDVTIKHIKFLYLTLWRHKASFFIYQFYDSFLRIYREIFIGEVPTPVIKEA